MDEKKYDETMQAIQLFEKLQKREIGKGEIDVVLNDFNNWNRAELLINNDSQKKNSHVKINYLEYLWVRIVDSLNKYGISYQVIKSIKKNLIDQTLEDEFTKAVLEDDEIGNVHEIKEKAAIGLRHAKESPEMQNSMKELLKSMTSYFQLLLNYVVVSKMEVKLLVNQNGDFDVVMQIRDEQGNTTTTHSNEDKLIECEPHLCIPFSHLATKHLNIDGLDCCTSPEKPITKQEHSILKIIRGKDYKMLESITICFDNGKPETLKIKELKKVKIESRIIEQIQKGTYGEFVCKYADGQSLYFTNERSHRLNGTE